MKGKKKREVIVLAMHGAPPLDFPAPELLAYFELAFKKEHSAGKVRAEEEAQWRILDEKIRRWPRNETNDPFYAGSLKLKKALERESGLEVVLGFNEFCAPSVEEAIEEACRRSPEKVVVMTAMLTPGGQHAGQDIPAAISRVKEKFPQTEIVYAWPFEVEEVARFLYRASQEKVSSLLKKK